MTVTRRARLTGTATLAPLQNADATVEWSVGLVHQLHTIYSDVVAALKEIAEHGQCHLAVEGRNVVLRPLNGNRLVVAGRTFVIPDDGVRLSPIGLPLSTAYYIYAVVREPGSETLALAAATSAHAPILGSGIEGQTGDATRTLVGKGTVDATGTWLLVVSWFNRDHLVGW